MWSRIHLIPLLQAEEDRDVVRRDFAQKAMEKELLGKEVPIYNKDRYDFRNRWKWRWRGVKAANETQIRTADIRCYTFECNKISIRKQYRNRPWHIEVPYVYTAWESRSTCSYEQGGTLPNIMNFQFVDNHNISTLFLVLYRSIARFDFIWIADAQETLSASTRSQIYTTSPPSVW